MKADAKACLLPGQAGRSRDWSARQRRLCGTLHGIHQRRASITIAASDPAQLPPSVPTLPYPESQRQEAPCTLVNAGRWTRPKSAKPSSWICGGNTSAMGGVSAVHGGEAFSQAGAAVEVDSNGQAEGKISQLAARRIPVPAGEPESILELL